MALRHRVGWDPRFLSRDPWLWPLGPAAEALASCAQWPSRSELDALYASRAATAGELRFVHDEKKITDGPRARAALYDSRITLANEVPTRPGNWHDLLNALCFITFPRGKRALHRRQYQALRERLPESIERLPAVRTREQDALTLFDEGGTVIAVHAADAPSLQAALRGASPRPSPTAPADAAAAIGPYVAAGRARVVPFGHALFEHMVEGVTCPGASARVLALPTLPEETSALLAAIDAALAAALDDRAQFLEPSEATHFSLAALHVLRASS